METGNGNIDDSEKEWNELEVLENEEEGSEIYRSDRIENGQHSGIRTRRRRG